MLKRIRRLKISLAAKCQLLFGAAVILIITAALYVPWQRMEQLMEQINERTARTLADWAEADHVARKIQAQAPGALNGAVNGAVQGIDAIKGAASQPTTLPTVTREKAQVEMILLSRHVGQLKRFETRALREFEKDPESAFMFRRQDNPEGPASFRYAKALYAWPSCMNCHERDVPPAAAMTAREMPAPVGTGVGTEPGASPNGASRRPPLIGMVSIEIPYQVDANQVFLNRIFIFLAALLAATTAIVVFYLITTRLILGPVRILQETAEKVSKGDLNIRSDISTGDEFQQLSETFNRMLVNLKQSEDQLRAINISLDMKLGELAESNLALYESNRLKSEFLANVSHELRTPLNSILGFAELLKDARADDGKNIRYIQNIVASGKNLLDLINDLLDLAKIEAGRMEVRSEPLSLTDLFEGLVSILKPLAEKKDVIVAAEVDAGVPILYTDGPKLQQVLYNFLSNAIKFSPANGKIDLRAERTDDDQVRIFVRDQGPGIDPEKQAVIFEKFRQLDGSVTRQHGGTGLGLAISKELTALLGGSIGVVSRPGEGATFWVVLPVKITAHSQSLRVAVANH